MDPNALRLELIQTVCSMPEDRLPQAAEFLRRLQDPVAIPAPAAKPPRKEWPHVPVHRLTEQGAYMVTTGTLQKLHIFHTADRLTFLEKTLLSLASKHAWQLEAWAVFSNHYHFVGFSQTSPPRLREFLSELHATTAREMNRLDDQKGRQVWHNFWDKHLSYEKSYLARLNYVHQNAVKHGLVVAANQYCWCSAAWFERVALPAQVKTIYAFKTDRLQVADDFEPLLIS